MKNKIIISLIAIFFSLLGGVNCFASPNGIGIEASINQSNPNIWYSESNLIPLSQFSQSDCGYRDNNYYIKGQIFDSTGTNTGLMNFGTSKTQSELNAANGLLISWLWFKTPSNYPASGDYYYQFFGFASGQSVTCGSPAGYAYIPFHVDKENNTITPNSLATNGTCGSDHLQTLDAEPTNLCESGTPDEILTYIPFQGWVWSCSGSGGGSSDTCQAYASESFVVGNDLSIQCGSSTGLVQVSMPTGTEACYLGIGGDMIQNADDSWTWTCTSDTSSVSCSTLSLEPETIPPTLPSDNSISCSITPTDFSTFGDCLGSIFRWLFLPSQSTINSFFGLKSQLLTKIPFGYVEAIHQSFYNLTLTPETDLTINMTLAESSVPIVDTSAFKVVAGTSVSNIYFGFIKALLWLYFGIWVFNLARAMFAHRQLKLDL